MAQKAPDHPEQSGFILIYQDPFEHATTMAGVEGRADFYALLMIDA
jgi:hypothetical protein